jgi:DNA/RNA endonuclease G (NUC1)
MIFGTKWGASFGALAGVGAVCGFMNSRKPDSVQAAIVMQGPTLDNHPAARHGLPIKERIRIFSGFIAAYDPSTKNPMWVLEHLNRESAYGEAQRTNMFFEDAACSFMPFFDALIQCQVG